MSDSSQDNAVHSYDGIQEYDNPLPGWWKWLFVATAVFSLFYVMYFHTGAAQKRSVYTAYEEAFSDNLRQQFSELGELQPDNATLIKYSTDARWLKVGQSVFKQHCVSCHGAEGGGVVGPNLCDVYWKNVKVIDDIAKILENGAGNGSMPAWKTRLHPNELVLVACYVASLRDTSPANAKGPEGNEVGPWTLAIPPETEPAKAEVK